MSWDFHTLQSLEFTHCSTVKNKHPVSGSSADGYVSLMRKVNREWRELSRLKGDSNSDNLSIQLSWAEKHFRMYPTSEHVKPWSEWATTAGNDVCQPRAERWDCSVHRFSKTGLLKFEKNEACSDESQLVLGHTEGRVRVWHQMHESMTPTCFVSTVKAGGGDLMVQRMFFWHNMGPLILINHHLNATGYLCIIDDHVQPLHGHFFF